MPVSHSAHVSRVFHLFSKRACSPARFLNDPAWKLIEHRHGNKVSVSRSNWTLPNTKLQIRMFKRYIFLFNKQMRSQLATCLRIFNRPNSWNDNLLGWTRAHSIWCGNGFSDGSTYQWTSKLQVKSHGFYPLSYIHIPKNDNTKFILGWLTYKNHLLLNVERNNS